MGEGAADPATVADMDQRQKRRLQGQLSAPPPRQRQFSAEALIPIYHASWFDPSPSRPHVRQRVQDRDAAVTAQRASQEAGYARITAPVVDDSTDPIGSRGLSCPWRATWRRAQHPLLPRPTRLFVWELLHGALPCGGATVSFYPAGHADLEHTLCYASTCQAVPRPLETLSHLFLECPVGKAALLWLSQLWVAIQPAASPPPPLSPAVWLADDWSTWRPGGTGLRPVWNLLRATMLKHVWLARQRVVSGSREAASFSAQQIVGAFVSEIRQLIRQDWQRVEGNLRTASGVGPMWLRGRSLTLTPSKFKRRWCARGVLASVTLGPCRCLSVHLSVTTVPLGP